MRRAGGKQFALLAGEPVLVRTLHAFQQASSIDKIIIVVATSDLDRLADEVAAAGLDKVAGCAAGGAERQDSVESGLGLVPESIDVVAIHDGARPLVTPDLIDRSVASLPGWDGVVVAVPVTDTVKAVSGETVRATLDRSGLWAVQTPQVFPRSTIVDAYTKARRDGFVGTDDASLVERVGGRVRVIEGSRDNLKITTPEDLAVAQVILESRDADVTREGP